ncbi:MAG: hypothetical protein KJ620_07745 [Candidatus Edwardsbacteria bacterium]|nr:hypothetical protein [Candidatus Edwardsbacteria bacterium]MBU1575725.1 hypothetical protein [Candidatus Edwardsbacteria bacterium]MBU2462574.1 hypothetical protein [Candidatus Edwardsbacteria bacterium]MBU2594225.1 hypothetical protein [Candidatus Edwardsbacteria bacterium]
MMLRSALIILIIVFLSDPTIAADSGESYDYLLVLPFQHNYYQPIDATALGQGNGLDFASGAAALFGNPAGIACPGRYQLIMSASNLSAGRSSLAVSTDGSPALPSAAAIRLKWQTNDFALGWRRAMDANLRFPDMLDPEIIDRAGLSLEQYAAGWSLSAIKNFTLGISVSLTRFDFKWDGPAGPLADGRGTAPGFSAGMSADLGQDFFFSAGFRSKTEMSCYTTFYGDSIRDQLKLAGAIPPTSWLSIAYTPEPGFEAHAGMELAGWHLVSSGYLEQMDYHLGCRIELIEGRLDALAGSYSLRHPLDPYLRRYDPHLQDLYFLTGGLACRYGPLRLVCSGATSQPLSGKGLNQNILSVSIEYQAQP